MIGAFIASGPIFSIAVKKYAKDFYDGKIKIEHDEDCEDDCKIDHGCYNIDQEYLPLFEEPK